MKDKILIVTRLILLIITVLLFLNSMKIYSHPFSGCELHGLATFEPGCSTWQYFGLGVGLVFIFWIIKPKSLKSKYLGFISVVLIALLGGPEAMKYGFHLEIWSNPSALIFYWREHGLAMLYGGIVGVVLLIILEKWLGIHKFKPDQ